MKPGPAIVCSTMKSMNIALVLIGAVCMAPSSALAETRSLSQQLRDAAGGQPVLLVNRQSVGVVARSPDGSFHQVLVPGQEAISYDPALELVWLLGDGSLSVLDLRLPQPVPVPILENGPHGGRIFVVRAGQRPEPGIYLRWTRQPRVAFQKYTRASLGPTESRTPAEIAEMNAHTAGQARAVQIVGREWLVKNFDRPVRKTSQRQQRFDRKVPGVPRDVCGKRTCGRAARQGKSNILWVVTGDRANHDVAWVACDLFDPGSRQWASPLESGSRTWSKETIGNDSESTCEPVFDASESAYLLSYHVCGAGSGCAELGQDRALGWLDPGLALTPPRPATPDPWGE
jgi:hypothetical protein